MTPPNPHTIKKKCLVLVKAREQLDEDADSYFPSGIKNEVVFMEITGKTLQNLYLTCQVSAAPSALLPSAPAACPSAPKFEFGRSRFWRLRRILDSGCPAWEPDGDRQGFFLN